MRITDFRVEYPESRSKGEFLVFSSGTMYPKTRSDAIWGKVSTSKVLYGDELQNQNLSLCFD